MATRVIQSLGPSLAKVARGFRSSAVGQAGGLWRAKYGLPVNPSEHGPIADLPDWSYADGRPAPPMRGHLRRQEKNRAIVSRIAQLSAEIDYGMEKWEAKRRKKQQEEEEKRRGRLQPKGDLLWPISKK